MVSDAPNANGVTHTICPSCLNRMVMLSPHTGGIDPAALAAAPGYFGDAFKHWIPPALNFVPLGKISPAKNTISTRASKEFA